jgi:hypothetical protein
MPQPEESAHKSHDQEQRRAHPTNKCQICRTVQEFGAVPQSRNIRFKVSPSGIVGGNFIQAAYAVYHHCQPTEQDSDERGHRAENEGRCRRMRFTDYYAEASCTAGK